MKIVIVTVSTAVALAIVAVSAGAAIESRSVCTAARAQIGATAFAHAFGTTARCHAIATPFQLQTSTAVRRLCDGDVRCVSTLSSAATSAAKRLVAAIASCKTPACVLAVFRAELRTATQNAVACAVRVSTSQFASCLTPAPPPPAATTTTPAEPAPQPLDPCSAGGRHLGIMCPYAGPA